MDKKARSNKELLLITSIAIIIGVGLMYVVSASCCGDGECTVAPNTECDGADPDDCDVAGGYGTGVCGCPDPDTLPGAIDGDTDGYYMGIDAACENLDCIDDDITIYPGAPELCDGKDNDCNGEIDDINNDYDVDGDGYCKVATCSFVCPNGGGDCDEGNIKVNPGASEVCANNIDDDCNDLADCSDTAAGCERSYWGRTCCDDFSDCSYGGDGYYYVQDIRCVRDARCYSRHYFGGGSYYMEEDYCNSEYSEECGLYTYNANYYCRANECETESDSCLLPHLPHTTISSCRDFERRDICYNVSTGNSYVPSSPNEFRKDINNAIIYDISELSTTTFSGDIIWDGYFRYSDISGCEVYNKRITCEVYDSGDTLIATGVLRQAPYCTDYEIGTFGAPSQPRALASSNPPVDPCSSWTIGFGNDSLVDGHGNLSGSTCSSSDIYNITVNGIINSDLPRPSNPYASSYPFNFSANTTSGDLDFNDEFTIRLYYNETKHDENLIRMFEFNGDAYDINATWEQIPISDCYLDSGNNYYECDFDYINSSSYFILQETCTGGNIINLPGGVVLSNMMDGSNPAVTKILPNQSYFFEFNISGRKIGDIFVTPSGCNDDYNLADIIAETDETKGVSLLHVSSEYTSFMNTNSLYVNKISESSKGVLVCVGANSTSQVHEGCNSTYEWVIDEFELTPDNSTFTSFGQNYSLYNLGDSWLVTGITGTGIALLDTLSITIWDENDAGMLYGDQNKGLGENIFFFTNFTYLNETVIPDGTCRISFYDDSSSYFMDYNVTDQLYHANRSFDVGGSILYRVNCSIDDNESVVAFDSIDVESDSNLTIWDSNDDMPYGNSSEVFYPGDAVIFYANYTNSTGFILNGTFANCSIDLEQDSIYEDMTWNDAIGLFEYSGSYPASGEQDYFISCVSSQYSSTFDRGSIMIQSLLPSQVPEFSTWAIIVALIAAVGGMAVIRKRR